MLIFSTLSLHGIQFEMEKMLKKVSLLPAIALAGFLYVAGAQGAFAGPALVSPTPALIASPHSLVVHTDYRYHGRHYAYRYHGRYYNHRSYHDGRWHYR